MGCFLILINYKLNIVEATHSSNILTKKLRVSVNADAMCCVKLRSLVEFR